MSNATNLARLAALMLQAAAAMPLGAIATAYHTAALTAQTAAAGTVVQGDFANVVTASRAAYPHLPDGMALQIVQQVLHDAESLYAGFGVGQAVQVTGTLDDSGRVVIDASINVRYGDLDSLLALAGGESEIGIDTAGQAIVLFNATPGEANVFWKNGNAGAFTLTQSTSDDIDLSASQPYGQIAINGSLGGGDVQIFMPSGRQNQDGPRVGMQCLLINNTAHALTKTNDDRPNVVIAAGKARLMVFCGVGPESSEAYGWSALGADFTP